MGVGESVSVAETVSVITDTSSVKSAAGEQADSAKEITRISLANREMIYIAR